MKNKHGVEIPGLEKLIEQSKNQKHMILMEYDNEAAASGHKPHYLRLSGDPKSPRNVKTACNTIDSWGIPYSTVEVREESPNGETIGLGNFDDLLLETEEKLLARWEEALGVKFQPI